MNIINLKNMLIDVNQVSFSFKDSVRLRLDANLKQYLLELNYIINTSSKRILNTLGKELAK